MRLPRSGACREIPEPTHRANSPSSTAFATDANSASNFASTSLTEISVAVGASVTPLLLSAADIMRCLEQRHIVPCNLSSRRYDSDNLRSLQRIVIDDRPPRPRAPA